MLTHWLLQGDALEKMDELIGLGVVVDAIICDPPYGKTANSWDTVIPLEAMWSRLNKLVKLNGAVVLFGMEPFSSSLRVSNLTSYKYDWIWEKTSATGHLNAKKQPLRAYENILLFYKKQCSYFPQKTQGHERKVSSALSKRGCKETECYGSHKAVSYDSTERYPRNVLLFPSDKQKKSVHPTQKPVALMRYLVKTYTSPQETVLDFTMGSGTTGVACLNTGRAFIGIELDPTYFTLAAARLEP